MRGAFSFQGRTDAHDGQASQARPLPTHTISASILGSGDMWRVRRNWSVYSHEQLCRFFIPVYISTRARARVCGNIFVESSAAAVAAVFRSYKNLSQM